MTSLMEIPKCKLVIKLFKRNINKLSIMIMQLRHDAIYVNLNMQIIHQITQAENKQADNQDYVKTSLMEFQNDDSLNNAM